MNHITAAALCCLLAFPLFPDTEEPERTSWTLTDTEGLHSLRVQIHKMTTHSSRFLELWFDTKYADVPLDTTSHLALVVFRGTDEIYTEMSRQHTLKIERRVLIWKPVDKSLLPDTIEYRAELHINESRFPLPNSMAKHFIVDIDPEWGIDRVEPPIRIEDTMTFNEGEFRIPRYQHRTLPIPLWDDSVHMMPIPLWDGQRDVIPIPNAIPEFREQPRDFIRPEWPPQHKAPDSTRRQRSYRGWPR